MSNNLMKPQLSIPVQLAIDFAYEQGRVDTTQWVNSYLVPRLATHMIASKEWEKMLALIGILARTIRREDELRQWINKFYEELPSAAARLSSALIALRAPDNIDRQAEIDDVIDFVKEFNGQYMDAMEMFINKKDNGDRLRELPYENVVPPEIANFIPSLDFGGRPRDDGIAWLAEQATRVNPNSKRAWYVVAKEIRNDLLTMRNYGLTSAQEAALQILEKHQNNYPEMGKELKKFAYRHRKKQRTGRA